MTIPSLAVATAAVSLMCPISMLLAGSLASLSLCAAAVAAAAAPIAVINDGMLRFDLRTRRLQLPGSADRLWVPDVIDGFVDAMGQCSCLLLILLRRTPLFRVTGGLEHVCSPPYGFWRRQRWRRGPRRWWWLWRR